VDALVDALDAEWSSLSLARTREALAA